MMVATGFVGLVGCQSRRVGALTAFAVLATLFMLPATSSAAVLPSLSVADVSVSEGNSGNRSASFTVTLTGRPTSTKVRVEYGTHPGSARSGDYQDVGGALTFGRNKTSRTVSVPIFGDTVDEFDETFTFALSSARGATLGSQRADGTILDDDPLAGLTITDADVPEAQSGQTRASFNVMLSAPSAKPITVDYATADGTAVAGSDYVAKAGRLSFAPGSLLQTVQVAVIGDTVADAAEEFFIDLSNATNASIDDGQGVGRIQDNGPLALPSNASLWISDASVSEGNSGTKTLLFDVSLSGTADADVSVAYATANGTAFAPEDYAATMGTLKFSLGGPTTQSIAVTINGDTRREGNESFYVNLLNPAGANVPDGQAVGTINNDERARSILSLRIKKRPARIRTFGRLSPAHAGRRVAVSLYKRRRGSFVRLRTKRPLLSAGRDLNGDGILDSRYSTRFKRPRRGYCRVVARFAGDVDHAPATVRKTFRC